MKRPLAFICLVYIMAAGVFIWLRPPDLKCFEYADGMTCRAVGTLYKIELQNKYGKEQSLLYLNQISYFEVIKNNQSQFINSFHKENKKINDNTINEGSVTMENVNDCGDDVTMGNVNDCGDDVTMGNRLPEGLVCYVNGSSDVLQIGSKVLIEGEFELYSTATNPGEFNSRLYYRILGISGKLKNADVENVSKDYNRIADAGYRLRLMLEEKIKSIYPAKEAGILMTMLLGNDAELDGDIKALYRQGGILHILSVSGLHISVLGYGFYKLLRKIGVPVKIAVVLSVIWMWFYGEMIGMGVSAFRAVVMFSLRMMALWCGRTYDLLTGLATAAALLIGSEPMYFYHSGFWLSFACVLAISILYPCFKLEEKDECSRLYSYSIRICNSFLLSASITVFTLPIMLWFYYEVSVWGLMWNLVVVPFASVIMGGGICTLFLPVGGLGTSDSFWINCSRCVSAVIVKGNCIILDLFEAMCRITEWTGKGSIILGKPAGWQILAFALLMIAFIMIEKKLKYMHKLVFLAALVCMLLLREPGGVKITFIDVGQGDGICIQNDNGNVYLVDGGSSDKTGVATYQILPFLKHEGISVINAIFLTHGDADHTGGVKELLQMQKGGVRIEKVILPALDNSMLQRDFKEIIELCNDNNTQIYLMSKGETLTDGELILTCMHPMKNYVGEANESSLVLYMVYKEFTALFTGDVGYGNAGYGVAGYGGVDNVNAGYGVADGGEDNVNAGYGGVGYGGEILLTGTLKELGISNVTLLKVAHHGSSGSTGERFLKQISPQVAIISCGKNNSYGHPHEDTIERLENVHCSILTTPECGAVTVKITSPLNVSVNYSRQ